MNIIKNAKHRFFARFFIFISAGGAGLGIVTTDLFLFFSNLPNFHHTDLHTLANGALAGAAVGALAAILMLAKFNRK